MPSGRRGRDLRDVAEAGLCSASLSESEEERKLGTGEILGRGGRNKSWSLLLHCWPELMGLEATTRGSGRGGALRLLGELDGSSRESEGCGTLVSVSLCVPNWSRKLLVTRESSGDWC